MSAVGGDAPTRKHKENMQSFKDTFSEHVAKVSKGILTNPFSQNKFTKLNCSETFPNAVSNDSEKLLSNIGTLSCHDLLFAKRMLFLQLRPKPS